MGRRLRILALVPGLTIAVVLIGIAGAVCDQSFWSTILALLSGIVGLEAGYIAGIAMRSSLPLPDFAARLRSAGNASPVS